MQNNKKQVYIKNLNTDNNISKTGYRALFLLLKLIESPKTREEVLECFAQDPILNTGLSKDTVTNTINLLKKVGCIISRPTQRTNNKYVLKSHPFLSSLSRENIEVLLSLRESIITLGDWFLLININNLYAKFAQFAPDEESKKALLYNHPLKNINNKILNELLINARIKKYIIISYDSPKNGEELLYFTPDYITLENKKLYVWGYNSKYEDISFLRVDRIKRINLINFLGENTEGEDFVKTNLTVRYKLRGLSAAMFVEENNAKIISQFFDDEYSLEIEEVVENEFNFLQKLLSYGADCLLLSPSSLKEKLLNSLKSIKAEYEND